MTMRALILPHYKEFLDVMETKAAAFPRTKAAIAKAKPPKVNHVFSHYHSYYVRETLSHERGLCTTTSDTCVCTGE